VTFRTTASGLFTVLHSFSGTSGEGCLPLGEPVQAADGNFYGTTTYCGEGTFPGEGTLFRMTPAGTVTTIRRGGFGGHPTPLLLADDGRLYGAAASSLFVATTAGDFTSLHVFTPAEGDRALFPPIQAADGNLYGLTFGSFDPAQGTAPGSLYQATTAGAATVLHTFAPTTGHRPYGTLTQGNDGALYGTTLLGGPGQRGVVFRVTSIP
jgi:uncharacterized repeat protein (TIGR03803 family)